MQMRHCKRYGMAVVALLCLLSLGLPLLYSRWSDIQLVRQGTLRPEQPGMLSAQGQETPMAYALYRNRFATQSALEFPGDEATIQQELLSGTEALAQAGALPELVEKQARRILEQPADEATEKEENGFASATYIIDQTGTSGACSVSARWQVGTGQVVSYTVTADIPVQDWEPYLSAYIAYLGLEKLPDWTLGSREGNEAWGWSQAGQLNLFFRRDSGLFQLGAVSCLEPTTEQETG